MIWKETPAFYAAKGTQGSWNPGTVIWVFLKRMCCWFPVLLGRYYGYFISFTVSIWLRLASTPEGQCQQETPYTLSVVQTILIGVKEKGICFINLQNDFSCSTFLKTLWRWSGTATIFCIKLAMDLDRLWLPLSCHAFPYFLHSSQVDSQENSGN